MTEPTVEEWTTAYNAYADKARLTGAQSIPTQEAMLSTSFGRAVLLCRVMEIRSHRARREIGKSFALTSQRQSPKTKATTATRYWWQREDD